MGRGRRMSSPFNHVLSASLKIPVQSLVNNNIINYFFMLRIIRSIVYLFQSFPGRIGARRGEDIASIPYIEDHSDCSGEMLIILDRVSNNRITQKIGLSSKQDMSTQIYENLDSRKSSSTGTVTGTLSLGN